eukprot:gnl/MRDRNA2_/MRDRNA2_126296_c0_seq1.p1 gnl/MRDRNA2_/MRDRNA2_126296_c0~~gnl/MRDRNA2_/MRDRNA2_126296_c0_seq1.p1  ORF type:complete len:424 (-),score=85.10 gnl/MRDRNA2_/MRDRNA2_126296_c0_seq1:85-1356(-)
MKRSASSLSHEPSQAFKKPRISLAEAQAQAQGLLEQQLGRVCWYNGRRQVGMMLGDDGREFFVPVGGSANLNMVPLTPGGLMHGTRVSYKTATLRDDSGCNTCWDVQPRTSTPQPGLECGVETRTGEREDNEDRVAAADVADIGFLAGVFDGHCGTNCADFVSQSLPTAFHNVYTADAQQVKEGISSLSPMEEEKLIADSLKKAFVKTDQVFCRTAKQNRMNFDGTTAVVAVLAHGFESSLKDSTVEDIQGGVAKLFVAWCGDSRAVLIRGSQAVELSRDHKPDRKDERERIEAAGGAVMEFNGLHRVGSRRGISRMWLSTSRAFGGIFLKEPDKLLTAEPELLVHTLTPEDWAVVLCSDGVTEVLSNQEIANVCWDAMVKHGKGPVEAAKKVVDQAQEQGSTDNITAFVMRLGWATPKKSKS